MVFHSCSFLKSKEDSKYWVSPGSNAGLQRWNRSNASCLLRGPTSRRNCLLVLSPHHFLGIRPVYASFSWCHLLHQTCSIKKTGVTMHLLIANRHLGGTCFLSFHPRPCWPQGPSSKFRSWFTGCVVILFAANYLGNITGGVYRTILYIFVYITSLESYKFCKVWELIKTTL